MPRTVNTQSGEKLQGRVSRWDDHQGEPWVWPGSDASPGPSAFLSENWSLGWDVQIPAGRSLGPHELDPGPPWAGSWASMWAQAAHGGIRSGRKGGFPPGRWLMVGRAGVSYQVKHGAGWLPAATLAPRTKGFLFHFLDRWWGFVHLASGWQWFLPAQGPLFQACRPTRLTRCVNMKLNFSLAESLGSDGQPDNQEMFFFYIK